MFSLKTLRNRSNPQLWIRLPGQFHEIHSFSKSDLLLPFSHAGKNIRGLSLDEVDYLPITKGYLVGIFACRFPGKQSVCGLMKRWPRKSIVLFHANGWLMIQFETKNDMEATRQFGPLSVFGIPLILHVMSLEFRFDAAPDFTFQFDLLRDT